MLRLLVHDDLPPVLLVRQLDLVAELPLELLQAKVLRNEYPPGYAPKRDTKAMIPLPHLEPELPAIAAFLAEAAQE